jgi:hypothetical protein
MKESELERIFVAEVKRTGGKAYKFVSPGNAGVPDRIVVLPGGKVGFVELKRPGEKPRKLQERQLELLTSLGCVALVVDGVEQIAAVLSTIQSPGKEGVQR